MSLYSRDTKPQKTRHMSPELPPSDTCSDDPNRQRVLVLNSGLTNRALVMAVMEKKILLGVQKRRTVAINSGLLMKKKKKKKTNQNSLLKSLVDYLKSDSYLFAPLTSSSSRFDFRSFKSNHSSILISIHIFNFVFTFFIRVLMILSFF